jgi:hypothetical protein
MPARTFVGAGLLAAQAAAAGTARFEDASAASKLEFTMTSGADPSRYILEVNGGGVALVDYDRDGDLDVFFANGATLDKPDRGPGSRLYANDGHGVFRDVTAEVGIDLRRWAMGVAAADYDGDGDDDLYVTCYGPDVLLRNDVARDGRFRDVTAAAGLGHPGWGTSAAFADLDADGDQDLYVTHYLKFDVAAPPSRQGVQFLGVSVMAGPAGLTAEHDELYENLGQGTFRAIGSASGCQVREHGYGLVVRIADLDADGRLDIFVGNDSTENFLFRNLGGLKFEEIGVVSGIAANYDGGTQATMCAALADVDGNGHPDVFTTSFSSDTDTLHLNLGNRFFVDHTSRYGLGMATRPFLGWGAGFYDFDSDGDEDLLIANGHVYPETATQPMDSDYEQPMLLFERRGPRFERAQDAGEVIERRYRGRSIAFGDLDDDGDVDAVLTSLNRPVTVLRNATPLQDVAVVELRDAKGSRFAHGSVVSLRAPGRVQRRWLSGGSYQSVDAPAAYFGLAGLAADVPLALAVSWPDGQSVDYGTVPRNRRLIVVRGATEVEARPLSGRR